jgi:hypothetical protein
MSDDLDAQAERQRRRAPEPGPEPLLAPIPPRRRKRNEYAALGVGFWIVMPILVTLALLVNPWILWIGLLVFGAIKVVTADPR